MATIYLAKVRSPHDLTWRFPTALTRAANGLGWAPLTSRLERTDGKAFMPQLTLPYLAALGEAYNRRTGQEHRFRILDEMPDRFRVPNDADMVWFTINSPNALQTYQFGDELRRAGVPTAVGGIHASVMPEEAAPHFDSVVTGEAETVLDQMLTDFDGRGRLADRYHGPKAPDLDHLPFPAWPRGDEPDYCPWVIPVQTSRGCRNACRFCSTTRFQGAQRRHRPVEDIVNEVRWLKESGIWDPNKVLFFTDNNIVSDTDHRRNQIDTTYAKALFKALTPLEVSWTGQGEINVADDPELVDLMAQSGCISLLVGFESLSQENLGEVGKPSNNVETYVRQIETLHQHDVTLIGCFIFGFDHDGPDVFEATAPFIQQYIDTPQLSILTPMPGTALFTRMEREGRLLHRDWSRYDITHVVHRPGGMSPEELEHGYRWITQKIYSWPAILGRAWRHTWRDVPPGPRYASRWARPIPVMASNAIYRGLMQVNRDDHLKGRASAVELS